MRRFSYSDYIKCIHTLRLNAVLQVAEESEDYFLSKMEDKKSFNNRINEVLKLKEEAEKFINCFLKPIKEIKKEEIELSSSYLNNVNSKDKSIIYYIINKDLIFFINIESKIDKSVEYKMINSCINIMRVWIRKNKTNKRYPTIIPVLIYTGKRRTGGKYKTDSNLYFRDRLSEETMKKIKYNLIDINIYSTKFLEEVDSKFSKEIIKNRIQEGGKISV